MLTRDSRILVGQGRAELHPLVNSAILRNIFDYLDVKRLKSVRETWTFWNEESCSLLQSKSKVTITWDYEDDKPDKSTLPNFMKYVKSVTPDNVFFRNYELADWCLHSKEVEMTQFWLQCGRHIRSLVLKKNFCFYAESYVRNVFYNWTPNMESLHIADVQFVNRPNYKQPVQEYKNFYEEEIDSDGNSEWIPPEEEFDVDPIYYKPVVLEEKVRKACRSPTYLNQNWDYSDEEEAETWYPEIDENDESYEVPMKKFKILENIRPNYKFRTFLLDPAEFYTALPLQWKELFIAYPNLETLSVRPVFHNEHVDNIKELLTDLIELQAANPDKLKSLKTLDVFSQIDDDGYCAVTNEHFEEAMKLNFKLESLDIFFHKTHELRYSTIGKYINKLSTTLKTLQIESGKDAMTLFPPPGKRTSFPLLNSLHIHLNMLSSNNVEFLQNVPNLKKILIGDCESPEIDVTEPRLFFNTITLEPLNALRCLLIGDDILTEDCIRKIGEWFPNLTEFGAILDDNLLWATYKFLDKSVEKLEIHGKGITDVGITEIEATENSDESKPSSSKFRAEESHAKRVKHNDDVADQILGIARMKKLRHLTISSVYNPNSESGYESVQLTDDAVYHGFLFLAELTYLKLSSRGEVITEGAFRDLCSRQNIMSLDTRDFYRGSEIKQAGMIRRQDFTKIEI